MSHSDEEKHQHKHRHGKQGHEEHGHGKGKGGHDHEESCGCGKNDEHGNGKGGHGENKGGHGMPSGMPSGMPAGVMGGGKPAGMPMMYQQSAEEEVEEEVKLGFNKLKEDLPALLQEKKPFTITTFASMYGVSDLEVCYALPEGMCVMADGSCFEDVWQELSTWKQATVIIQYKGSAFEISTTISKGSVGHGFYNMMGAETFGGHIKHTNISTIAFTSVPFMGLESYSVLFFDKSGGLIFSVYVGRENRSLIESAKSSFLKLQEKYKKENTLKRKSLVVYSSLTGNTKKVAEAVAQVIPNCDIVTVDEVPANLDEYYFISVGYWVDRGLPDKKSKKFIKSIKNMNVALFGTLGAYPDSPHAKGCMRDSEAMLKVEGKNNNVLGSFLCLGKIDEKLLDYMGKFMGDSHPMTPERKARLLEAQTHPDNNDLTNVQLLFKTYVTRLGL